MAKKHRKQGTPGAPGSPPEVTPAPEPITPEITPDPTPSGTLEELIKQLPEALRAKGLEQLQKLVKSEGRAEAAKAYVAFDADLKGIDGKGLEVTAEMVGNIISLPKFLSLLQEKHSVSLDKRRIVISYPDNKFSLTHSPQGSNGGGKTGSGGGFTSRGKVQDETGAEYNSLHAFCQSKSIQYEGRRTAIDAVKDCLELGTKKPYPYTYKVEDKEGKFLLTQVTREA